MGTHKLVHIRQISQNPAVAALAGNPRQAVRGRGRAGDVRAVRSVAVGSPVQYADLIPGTLETIAHWRQQGIRIGSSTGYPNR